MPRSSYMAAKGKALGRGLGALIDDNKTQEPSLQSAAANPLEGNEIDVGLIDLYSKQPRKSFDADKIAELAQSVAEHGIIQPLVLKKKDDGRFVIIAGERRYRAARKAGLKTVPAVIRQVDDKTQLELSLIENIQREDLNPIEEATAMRLLMDEYELTQEELSSRIGKSRSLIANTLRLLALPDKTREMLIGGKLSTGHARALLALDDGEETDRAAAYIVSKGLSVRETENYVKWLKDQQETEKKPKKKREKDPYFNMAESELSARLGTRVVLKGTEQRGSITIAYYDNAQLQALYAKLNGIEEK